MHLKLAGGTSLAALLLSLLALSLFHSAVAEDPYRFFNWNVTYGDIFPLGVRQRVSLNLNLNLFHCIFHTLFCCFFTTMSIDMDLDRSE